MGMPIREKQVCSILISCSCWVLTAPSGPYRWLLSRIMITAPSSPYRWSLSRTMITAPPGPYRPLFRIVSTAPWTNTQCQARVSSFFLKLIAFKLI